MNEKSRLHSSLLNLMSGFANRILIMFTGFAVRTVFIKYLGSEYLGVNGLYTSILSMLSLAELGFGTAMVYSMYKPLAHKDFDKLQQLMQLYRKVYTIIGTVILTIGICLIPFLDYLIKGKSNVDGLIFYYILFLINTVTSYYFFAYRNSLLIADQKAYITINYNSLFNLIKSFIQIFMLVCFHSYTLYLVTQIISTVVQNIYLAFIVKKMYPVFDSNTKQKLPIEEKKRIFKDVQALMLAKVSFVVLNGTDNIIISAFVGLKWVGLLSNYFMLIEAVNSILTQVTNAITASLGNYFQKKDKESGYNLFCRIIFINLWLYGIAMIAFIVLLNPFVTLWLGNDFLLGAGVVYTLAINFFVTGIINTLWVFRSTLGLFTQGKYRPIITAAINLILSIGLSYVWGVAGVLVATSISRLCINLWYDPWILHKYGFNKSVKPFFKKNVLTISLLLLITTLMIILSRYVIFVNGLSVTKFIIMVLLTGIIPNIVLTIFFYRTDEFQYFYDLIKVRFFKQ